MLRSEGLERIKEGVRRFVPHPVLPPAPPLREERGTGLDRVVQDLPDEDDREAPRREKLEKKRKSKESEPRPKGSVGSLLRERAKSYEEKNPEKKKNKRKRKRDRGDDRAEKKRISRGMQLAPIRVRMMIVLTVIFNCPRPGRGRVVEAGSEIPGTSVEVRADRNVEIPGGPSRRRHRGQLAQQEDDGLREPGDVEPRSQRSRSRGKKPEGSNHPRNLPGSLDERQPGRFGGRPHTKAEGLGSSHGRSEMAERTAFGTDPSPECRSGYNRGEGSGGQGRIENAEVEDSHHQDEEQIGTQREPSVTPSRGKARPRSGSEPRVSFNKEVR